MLHTVAYFIYMFQRTIAQFTCTPFTPIKLNYEPHTGDVEGKISTSKYALPSSETLRKR